MIGSSTRMLPSGAHLGKELIQELRPIRPSGLVLDKQARKPAFGLLMPVVSAADLDGAWR